MCVCRGDGPSVHPFGPMSHLNWAINPAAMQERYEVAQPIAAFCGQIALRQLRKHNPFIQEQPYPSSLYEGGLGQRSSAIRK